MRKTRHIVFPWLAALLLSACAVAPKSQAPSPAAESPDAAAKGAAAPSFDWSAVTRSLAAETAQHGVEVAESTADGVRLVIPAANGFETAKARLRPALAASLSSIAPVLTRHPAVHAEILGHTDSVGREGYNMLLSRQRARAVRDFLMNAGIDAARLSADGRGETAPVADNDTPEGRSKNRRVEIRLFVPR